MNMLRSCYTLKGKNGKYYIPEENGEKLGELIELQVRGFDGICNKTVTFYKINVPKLNGLMR